MNLGTCISQTAQRNRKQCKDYVGPPPSPKVGGIIPLPNSNRVAASSNATWSNDKRARVATDTHEVTELQVTAPLAEALAVALAAAPLTVCADKPPGRLD